MAADDVTKQGARPDGQQQFNYGMDKWSHPTALHECN